MDKLITTHIKVMCQLDPNDHTPVIVTMPGCTELTTTIAHDALLTAFGQAQGIVTHIGTQNAMIVGNLAQVLKD